MKESVSLLDEVRCDLKKLKGQQITDLAARSGVSRSVVYNLRAGGGSLFMRLHTLESLQQAMKEELTA